MNTQTHQRDTAALLAADKTQSQPSLMSSSSLEGNDVRNAQGEDLGDVKDFMIDLRSGKIAYAVLSFGGLLGMGDKLFAVPWAALKLDTENKCFTLDVEQAALKDAPGFDKDHWPSMADPTWARGVHSFYGSPYGADSTP
jgi:sporulation protein YlmC with PRC-barrel domain